MNLLVKSLKQLLVLAVALFFLSCEDETTLGYSNPNKKFTVTAVELDVPSSVVFIDSVVTDNKAIQPPGITMVGRYNDPVLGSVRAESYLRITPVTSSKLPDGAIYDSASIQLRLNYTQYGVNAISNEVITIHDVNDERIIEKNAADSSRRYYSNTTFGYDAQPVGQLKYQVNYDVFKSESQKSTKDTSLISGRINGGLGKDLFDLAAAGFEKDAAFVDFNNKIKGIVLRPSQGSSVVGLSISSTFSFVRIHYHTSSDTSSYVFGFAGTSFTNVTTDRVGELAGSAPYTSVSPTSGLRIIQNGSAAITKLDLSNFYAFADTITAENIVINEAELVIPGVQSADGLEAHSALILRVMKDNNQFAYSRVRADTILVQRYGRDGRLFGDGSYYNVVSDIPSNNNPYAYVNYNADKDQLSGYLTLFAQNLFKHRKVGNSINENRLKYLALYPFSPSAPLSVNRSIFQNNIKLRIKYTRPTIQNNQ